MQYTIRSIPEALDAALRRRARDEGKSLNAVALEVLREGAGLAPDRPRRRQLGDLAGSWREDPEFDRAIADQRRIDKALWK
jgi:plasmid stability protein